MPDMNVRYWQTMTAPEAARLEEQDAVAVLPLAAIEQHGPHLPLSTDLDICRGLIGAAFDHTCNPGFHRNIEDKGEVRCEVVQRDFV